MLMHLSKQRGITMMEVLVTIIITSVGLLGLNSLQLKANRSTLDSGNRSQAVWVLEDLTNRMRANVTDLAQYDTAGAELKCDTITVPTICSAYHSGSGRVTAPTACAVAEQAESDIYEVLCGYGSSVNSSDVTFSSAANFIANPGLKVAVNSNNVAEITLSWDVRTSGTKGGETIYALQDGKNADHNIDLRTSISTRVHP